MPYSTDNVEQKNSSLTRSELRGEDTLKKRVFYQYLFLSFTIIMIFVNYC